LPVVPENNHLVLRYIEFVRGSEPITRESVERFLEELKSEITTKADERYYRIIESAARNLLSAVESGELAEIAYAIAIAMISGGEPEIEELGKKAVSMGLPVSVYHTVKSRGEYTNTWSLAIASLPSRTLRVEADPNDFVRVAARAGVLSVDVEVGEHPILTIKVSAPGKPTIVKRCWSPEDVHRAEKLIELVPGLRKRIEGQILKNVVARVKRGFASEIVRAAIIADLIKDEGEAKVEEPDERQVKVVIPKKLSVLASFSPEPVMRAWIKSEFLPARDAAGTSDWTSEYVSLTTIESVLKSVEKIARGIVEWYKKLAKMFELTADFSTFADVDEIQPDFVRMKHREDGNVVIIIDCREGKPRYKLSYEISMRGRVVDPGTVRGIVHARLESVGDAFIEVREWGRDGVYVSIETERPEVAVEVAKKLVGLEEEVRNAILSREELKEMPKELARAKRIMVAILRKLGVDYDVLSKVLGTTSTRSISASVVAVQRMYSAKSVEEAAVKAFERGDIDVGPEGFTINGFTLAKVCGKIPYEALCADAIHIMLSRAGFYVGYEKGEKLRRKLVEKLAQYPSAVARLAHMLRGSFIKPYEVVKAAEKLIKERPGDKEVVEAVRDVLLALDYIATPELIKAAKNAGLYQEALRAALKTEAMTFHGVVETFPEIFDAGEVDGTVIRSGKHIVAPLAIPLSGEEVEIWWAVYTDEIGVAVPVKARSVSEAIRRFEERKEVAKRVVQLARMAGAREVFVGFTETDNRRITALVPTRELAAVLAELGAGSDVTEPSEYVHGRRPEEIMVWVWNSTIDRLVDILNVALERVRARERETV